MSELNSDKLVVVGMSGGVDSSVTAALLKRQGYRVVGLFMRNWEETDDDGVCPAAQDYQDVKAVCEQLDIPYYSVNYSKQYFDDVFQYVIDTYKMGETPNPDVLCNQKIKFKLFYDYAMKLGADYLATGHYCQVKKIDGKNQLIKGIDQNKDQTYFLCSIDPKVLDKVMFPLGGMEKSEVRKIANELNLKTKAKKDSTGICFIGERKFRPFLNQYIQTKAGPFIDLKSGEKVGEHHGQSFYTLGQRKGLGLGGAGEPWFVASKDRDQNIVYVVRGKNHPVLYQQNIAAEKVNWLVNLSGPQLRCKAKIRYRQQDQDCTIKVDEKGLVKVEFDRPQWAIAKSQFVVFYQDDICLGGGPITHVDLQMH